MDLSETGIRLALFFPELGIGDPVILEFRVPGDTTSIRLDGMVVWMRASRGFIHGPMGEEYDTECGITFLKATDQFLAHVLSPRTVL